MHCSRPAAAYWGAVAVVAAGVLTGCSTGPAHGTIIGELAAVGGPAPGLPRPLAGSVRLTNTHTHASKVVTVGVDGRYSLPIAPGSYTLMGKSPQYNSGQSYDCQAQRAAVVVSSKTTTSDVYCQEK